MGNPKLGILYMDLEIGAATMGTLGKDVKGIGVKECIPSLSS